MGLLMYVLSPIPVAWVLNKTGTWDRLEPAFMIFYGPIAFLADRFEIIGRFYDWQERLFRL